VRNVDRRHGRARSHGDRFGGQKTAECRFRRAFDANSIEPMTTRTRVLAATSSTHFSRAELLASKLQAGVIESVWQKHEWLFDPCTPT
jgi:hypothetical protein